MAKKIGRLVYWTPRILSIALILFLSLFSLDVFDSCINFLDCAIALFMHNIPIFALIGFLILAWKREWIGGIGFILAGILYFIFVAVNMIKTGFEWFYLAWVAQISGVAFFIGIMFFLNWFRKKKK
jgi:hypothetical protein